VRHQKSSKKRKTNEKNFLLFFAYLAVFDFGGKKIPGVKKFFSNPNDLLHQNTVELIYESYALMG